MTVRQDKSVYIVLRLSEPDFYSGSKIHFLPVSFQKDE